MNAEPQQKLLYQIGPGSDLTREIGQIIVNYSECERSIFSIFKNVMNLSSHDAYLLMKHANMNSEKMLAVVKAEAERIRPEVLIPVVREALDLFKSTIEQRNIVAHWQWAITEGDTGLAFNDLKSKPGEHHSGRPFELSELQAISWKLAKAAILLANTAIMMFERRPSLLSQGAWAPSAYSNRGAMDEMMVVLALDQSRNHIQRMEEQAQQGEQKPS